MIKKLIEIFKSLYLKINCVLCCKSQCELQLGRDNINDNNNNNENYKNDKDE